MGRLSKRERAVAGDHREAIVGKLRVNPAEPGGLIFEGRHYGSIFGTAITAAILGGAMGPWLVGSLHDRFGSYAPGLWISIGLSLVSAAAIWLAAPRRVRHVAGRMRRAAAD